MFKRLFFVPVFCFALLVAATSAARAGLEAGEAYVFPSFEELMQTGIMLGALDANDTETLNEYIRLMYCDLYKENYKDDFTWSNVRKQIYAKIDSKNEYYRTLYQIIGRINLEPYDFRLGGFTLTARTQFKNVGYLSMFSVNNAKPYCDMGVIDNMRRDFDRLLPRDVNVVLNHPFTFTFIKMTESEAEDLIARMQRRYNSDRELFVRIRLRIVGPPPGGSEEALSVRNRLNMLGSLVGVDVFMDREMTQPVIKVPIVGDKDDEEGEG